MAENFEDSKEIKLKREVLEINEDQKINEKEIVKKESIPHFFPTYRVKRKFYPIPILIVVIISGALAYLTYIEAGIQIDGGYFSEEEFGAIGGLLNGLIYTMLAAFSAFVIIFIIKKKGIEVLVYIFGISFALVAFFQTWFFGEIIIYLLFSRNPKLYYLLDVELIFFTAVFVIFIIYKYFTSPSINIKNFIVIYIGLLIGASMGVFLPLWSTLAILIGISCWDLFAVLYKHGPIKQLVEMVSEPNEGEPLTKEELKEKIKRGEYEYDTSKLEIGIGDLAFYSMLTSSALIHTNNLIIMILTAIATIIGTGITISGLKRNKLLPGLPISIFMGIATMLVSWYFISTVII